MLGPLFVIVTVSVRSVPATTLLGPEAVTARSAWVPMVVLAVALVTELLDSAVLLVVVAVVVSTVPLATLAAARAVTVKLAEAPAGSVVMLSLTPLLLLLRVAVGPLVWAWETKVTPAGKASLRLTF